MTFKNLAAAACLSLFSATSTFAATFTVGGNDFDITTISGTFTDLQGQLESQLWWGDDYLARQFATAVSTQLGTADATDNYGPLFVHGRGQRSLHTWAWYFPHVYGGSRLASVGGPLSTDRNFAVCVSCSSPPPTVPNPDPPSPVPLPAGGLLLLSGLAGVAALKRRKKRTA
jgi:hypothetical protein